MQLGHTPAQLQACRLRDLQAMIGAYEQIDAEQREANLRAEYPEMNDEEGQEE